MSGVTDDLKSGTTSNRGKNIFITMSINLFYRSKFVEPWQRTGIQLVFTIKLQLGMVRHFDIKHWRNPDHSFSFTKHSIHAHHQMHLPIFNVGSSR
jgi:hypothetical protein